MASPEIMAMAFDLLSSGFDKEKLSGEFLEIDEAICWVAFDRFQPPPFGPRAAHEFLIHADLAIWLDEQAERNEQVFKIAREQVFNAIENGHILLVGKETDRESDEVNGVFNQPLITFVTPQMLADGGWQESNPSYEVGELHFDGLFVRFSDVQKLFGPFKKSPPQTGTQPIGANPLAEIAPVITPEGKRRGRRPKYDWEKILATVSLKIGQSRSLPENQAALERLIAQHCMETLGDEPSPSLIRQKASGLFETLRLNSR